MSGRQSAPLAYTTALRLYRRLPRPVRLFIIRRVAPGHTVGALCLIEHEGRLLMLEQHHRNGLTFPGGLLNRGEDAATAVVREVEEETGLVVQVGLPFAIVVDPSSRRVDILFWVQADDSGPVLASGEATGAQWVAPGQMGEVDDPTAEALAEFARFRSGTGAQGRVVSS